MAEQDDDFDFTVDESDLNYQDPSDKTPTPSKARITPTGKLTDRQKQGATQIDNEEAREALLRQELANVKKINEVLEGVIGSLDKSQTNMDSVSRTVDSASSLLQTWTRILSQAEHNQRLILNPSWHGASQDLVDAENDAVNRQHEAQRRHIEEQQRREAATRKVEEDETRKAEAVPRGVRGTRVRGRATGRTTPGSSVSSSTAGYAGGSSQAGRGSARGQLNTSRNAGGASSRSKGRARGNGL